MVDWCREPAEAATIAAFFVAHAEPSYISHSELQFGRAESMSLWSDTLAAQIEAQAVGAANNTATASGSRLALATSAGELAAMAFVSLTPDVRRPFATVEDLLIAPDTRGCGLGASLLGWIETECRDLGFHRLFLESGADNHAAHRFFARQGFVQTSIVMVRDLERAAVSRAAPLDAGLVDQQFLIDTIE
ncbi:GNAT family N-acetyltransferase [Lichenifustis flavocetrariae]|uniref:GNAT family N-acetyltransferase n=1 Tax=Lichenifustis flavocetrariae TaxID=2949735 RepID=A0AA42CLB8_9HYPH|nr:GNAT family N-acetyltransferase [Lichenifustis flavocetrariae]MCW6507217.1 GNAT family N-acetyltransferase [Lichenifustis flavocetrariae]